jgi:hypothetical protein
MYNGAERMPDPRQIERARHDAQQASEHQRAVWRLPYFNHFHLDVVVAAQNRAARIKAQRGHVPMGVTAHGGPGRAFAVLTVLEAARGHECAPNGDINSDKAN